MLQVESLHRQLLLLLAQFGQLLFLLGIDILDLDHVLQGLLEELNCIYEHVLSRLVLDNEVEDFVAELGARSRRQMQRIHQLVVLLLYIVLTDVDKGLHK